MAKDSGKKEPKARRGVSRRRFLGTVGTGTVGVAVLGGRPATGAAEQIAPAGDLTPLTLVVNGKKRRTFVEPRWTLLYVLRDVFGMTGTKPGCERGECGACTILIDGQARYACMILALEVEGREITTIEGMMLGEQPGPVQQAFIEEDGFQCGFCTPGQVMAAESLLRQKPDPSIDEIREGMSGNLCRCGAYKHIFKAVQRGASLRQKS